MESNLDLLLHPSGGPKDGQLKRILRDSYEWFQSLETSNRNVRKLIQDVAFATRAKVSPDNIYNNWPYVDLASVQDVAGLTDEAYAHFADRDFQSRELLELGMAAMIALLVEAGDEAGGPPAAVVTCPAGSFFKIGTGCVGGQPLSLCPETQPSCSVSQPCPSSPPYHCDGTCCLLVVD